MLYIHYSCLIVALSEDIKSYRSFKVFDHLQNSKPPPTSYSFMLYFIHFHFDNETELQTRFRNGEKMNDKKRKEEKEGTFLSFFLLYDLITPDRSRHPTSLRLPLQFFAKPSTYAVIKFGLAKLAVETRG